MRISHECRQELVFADYGIHSMKKLFSNRSTLQRLRWRATLDLLRAVSCRELFPTYFAREPARHRGGAGCQRQQALLHGLSPQHQSIHLGRYQRVTQLPHLGRLDMSVDQARL